MAKLKEYGFDEEEKFEVGKKIIQPTKYPKPSKHMRIYFETYNLSIEDVYYWLVDFLRVDADYYDVIKITDVFAAAEQSAFFGAAQSRLGIQQDKISQFLATIGKMVKELFQIVRELRILDERVRTYDDSFKEGKGRESAEITLKGIWVDMVEGGGKNPSSVYGMANELQFTTLPDLFYSIHPTTVDTIDEMVEKKAEGFNRKVKEVLKRKLRTYITWKEETYKEIKARRLFTLKYLRQHYDIIRMYMAWVKPYLRNVQRLQMADRSKKIDLISAFEGSIIEIEVIGRKKKGDETFYSCIMLSFDYRTKPSMDFHQEGYQHRGPLHIGRTIIDFRGYAWTDVHLKNYQKYKEDEEMDLLKTIDASVKAAYDALGADLQKYLEEAGETFEKPLGQEDEKPKQPTVAEPFISVFKGFGELFGVSTDKKKKAPAKKDMYKLAVEREKAHKESIRYVWRLYDKFKKAHKMLAW